MKIITERATTDKNVDFLLKQIESRNAPARLRALKAMRCLSMSASLLSFPCACGSDSHRDQGSFVNLCTQRSFRALVTCLENTLPPTPDVVTQKEALYILARLMTSFFQGKDMAVEAGIINWLKQVRVPGYENVVEAVFDPERFDANDISLWEVVNTIMDEYEGGRKLMIEAGLIGVGEDEDERAEVEMEVAMEVEVEVEVEVGAAETAVETGAETEADADAVAVAVAVAEVEVEAEVIDAATAQRAQRAWEQVGALQENSFPGESNWTQG